LTDDFLFFILKINGEVRMLKTKPYLIKRMVLTLALLLGPFFLNAVDYTSVQNGNWGTPTTWNPNGIPTQGDNVFINHQVTLDANRSIDSVIINSGGELRCNIACTLFVYGN